MPDAKSDHHTLSSVLLRPLFQTELLQSYPTCKTVEIEPAPAVTYKAGVLFLSHSPFVYLKSIRSTNQSGYKIPPSSEIVCL